MLSLSGEPYFYLIVRYDSLEDHLKREFDSFLLEIQDSLLLGSETELQIQNSYNKIFKLRMLAFKSILEENESIPELLEESYSYFEDMAHDERLGALGANILFAIRSNMRVASSLMAEGNLSTEAIETGLNPMGGTPVDFDQFTTVLMKSAPPDFSKILLDWIKTSLTIEYCIIAGVLLKEKKVTLETESVDKIASLLANAAQTYNAISIEFGLLKLSSHTISDSMDEDPDFIAEQKKMADADIQSYSKNWK